MTAVLDEDQAPRTHTHAAESRWWRLSAPAAVALGALTGLLLLGRPSFFLDETVSTTMAVAPWHRFTAVVVHREANMVLYTLVLRAWIALGHGEATIRSLSVLASLGTIALVMALARSLFDRRVALVSGVLLALDPLFVQFAQDARGYALSLLLTGASSLLIVRAVRGGGRWTWAAWVACAVLAAYANFWAALVPLAQVLSLALLPPGTVPWRRVAPAAGAGLCALVPLGLLVRSTDASGTNWAAGTAAGQLFSRVRSVFPHALIDVGAVVVVAGLVWLAAFWRRRSTPEQLERQWPLSYLLCLAVVPVLAVVLVSFSYKPLLVLRYLCVCLPPVVVLAAWVVTRLRGRSRAALLGALLFVSCAGLADWYVQGPGENWRGVTSYLAAQGDQGDGVLLFAPYTRVAFEWYFDRDTAAEARLHPVYPSLGWGVDPLRFDTQYTPIRQSAIASAARGYRQIWLVLCQAALYPGQEQALLRGLRDAGLEREASRAFAGIQVVRYVAPAP